ncbi:MAG: hypothetical protein JWO05_2673 [Gemmatimonadetes bacterium]|nr:hypothetical protein [Gemmatimonadota bacterium]
MGIRIYRTETENARSVAESWRTSAFVVRLIAVLAASVAFAGVILITEPPGPGLDPDAASYLGAAESWAAGSGFRVPTARWDSPDSTQRLAHFPPGFPRAIALPHALGLPAPQAARLVEALAAFFTFAILMTLVGDAAGVVPSLVSGALLALTPAMTTVHLSVLSEPLFLACCALLLLAMVRGPRQPWWAGLAAAAAVMVRYAGVAAGMAAALWALAQPGTLVMRLRNAVIAGAPTLVAVGAWALALHTARTEESIRSFAIYGDLGPTLALGRSTIVEWLAPSGDPLPFAGWIATGALIVLVAVLVRGTRLLLTGARNGAARDVIAMRTLAALATLASTYVAVLFASRLLADPDIPLDERLLAPLMVLVIAAVVIAGARWWMAQEGSRRGLLARVALTAILVAWSAAAFARVRDDIEWTAEYGSDFASDQWRRSPLIDWARTEARDAALFSNWPVVGYFHVGRPLRELPETYDAHVLRAFSDTLARRHGVILGFDAPSPGVVRPDSLARLLGLVELARFSDGRAWGPARSSRLPSTMPSTVPSTARR